MPRHTRVSGLTSSPCHPVAKAVLAWVARENGGWLRSEVQVPARLSLIQRAAPFLSIAASAMFVVSVFRLQDALQERNDAQAALKAATASTTALSEKLAQSDSLVAAMSGASVRVVELASTQNMSPGAKMFWDRVANRWTLVTHDLQPVPAGRPPCSPDAPSTAAWTCLRAMSDRTPDARMPLALQCPYRL